MPTPAQVIQRAERLIAAELNERRQIFGAAIGNATAGFDLMGKFGGSSHRRHLHQLCATELRERGRLLVDAFVRSHAAMSAKASEDHRRGAKLWIDKFVSREARDLEQFLWKPRPAVGETGKADHLSVQLWREIDCAHARIDDELNRVERNLVESIRRCVARGVSPFVSLFRSAE
jgi:hypothetical protein